MFWFVLILFPVIIAELPKTQDYFINTREGRCNLDEFDCSPGELVPSCLPFNVVRDCIPDCLNGEDEKCGLEQSLCDVNVKRSNSMCGKCVHNDDLDRFCVDRKWRNLCYEENVRQCATNSNCVHETWLNDGEDDGSDELKCPTAMCSQQNTSRPLIKNMNNAPNLHSHLEHSHLHHNHSDNSVEEKEFPCDCADLMRKNPKLNSTIAQKAYDPRCYEAGQCSFPILCNFELFGGGWTVIMHRRWPAQIHFNRTWIDYKMGFGVMRAGQEFWVGNDRIHSLTFGRKCANELIVLMKTAREGKTLLARYESIVVADEPDAYKLTLGPLLSENPLFTPIDGLLTARDRQFVTFDRQQKYCDQNYGGFWLPPDTCGQSTLNSDLQAHRGHSGVMWATQRLVEVTMLIRPRLYIPPITSTNTNKN